MIKSPWRIEARRIIDEVIRANEGLPEKELRRAISKAYPFGARQWHPYKIWCSEVKRQLIGHGFEPRTKPKDKGPQDPEQLNLFAK